MSVIKRNGCIEQVCFDKIFNRLNSLCMNDTPNALSKSVNVFTVCKKTIEMMTDNMKTELLDKFSATICADLITSHSDYSYLGARILISNIKKNLLALHGVITFTEITGLIYEHLPSYLNDTYLDFVNENAEELDLIMNDEFDYNLDFFGFKTLEKSYLIKNQISDEILETPQSLWLRVAVAIQCDSNESNEYKLEKIKKNYENLATGKFIHATPTLFNAGSKFQQLSSCYLLGMEDSLEGIFKTVTDSAKISKWAGGIGIHVSNIRSNGQLITKTNGKSAGIIPMLRVFNDVGRYVNQCFTPDTWVYSNDGPLQIKDITTNNQLITIDGSFKQINEIIKNEINKEILEISTNCSLEPIKVTNEHEILVIKNATGLKASQYISANEIRENDYVGYAIPTYENDIITYDRNYCTYYGILFGLYNSNNIVIENNTLNITINMQTHYSMTLFIKKYLMSLFVPYTIMQNETIVTIKSEYNEKKQLDTIDENILHLPKEKIMIFLKSVMETEIYNKKTYTFHSDSAKIMLQLKYLFLRIGILISFTIDNKYCLTIPEHSNFDDLLNIRQCDGIFFKYDNMLWTKVTTIKKIQYVGEVYDFNMIENHNYLTDLGIVHNSGKRNGSIAIYLEPWHADIIDFLELRKNGGNENDKCRDLFLALWVPDRFMRAVENNEKWYLMSDDECPGLTNVYGTDFDTLYQSYIDQKKYIKEIDASIIWQKILTSQIETGTPYISYKDAINRKSNQQNLGVIKSSNLCNEIVQYSSDKEYAVCNLASIALNKFYDVKTKIYDYDELHDIAKQVTCNLNRIIDINYYPTPETQLSNFRHRPIGVGVQGFADLLALMKIPYESAEAIKLSAVLLETIYHGCLEQSNELAKEQGYYETFKNSPLSMGKFQFNLWQLDESTLSGKWNWIKLRESIIKFGTRNSLTTALMPTASTSQILGNNECFEPITSNLYTRRTLAGNFIVFNKYLQHELEELGLWNEQMKNTLMSHRGSVQNIASIPQNIKDIYKTVWEIKQKAILDHAISRGPFVDQSQSMNLFFKKPDGARLTTALFYGWRKGLKTGMYYLRSQPSAEAQQFTVEPTQIVECTTCSS